MTTVKCPTCKKTVEWREDNPWRPFCGERCRLIDLGEWFEEKHRIPSAEEPFSEQSGDRPDKY